MKTEHTVLDLGTADGKEILEYYPLCKEILGTDFSEEMIKTAKNNSKRYERNDVHFKVMDNFMMDTPEDYFDIITAKHTPTDKTGIFKSLKKGGKLIVRGVDKLDCWSLKMMFGHGQCYDNQKPISQKDYEEIINAGFKNVELIPIHVIEYYKTEEDLIALLLKTPILQNDDWSNNQIDMNILNKYIKENITDKGIKLIRRYYGIIAVK